MNGPSTQPLRATALAITVVLAAVVAGTVPAASSSSADIVVQNGESIQQAVNSASPGDVIAVEPGRYPETVRVNTSGITIRASDPTDPPEIEYAPDRPKNNATFEIIESGVTLSNLRIERIGHSARNGSNATAAVAIVPVDSNRPDCTFSFTGCEDVTKDVTVKGSTIVGDFQLENESAAGVAITDGIDYLFLSDIAGDASNITITNNKIYGFSGGVALVAEYGGTITDVEISDNNVHDNLVVHNGTAQGTGVGFVRNTTDGYFQNILITGNDITDNHYGVRVAGNETNSTLEDVDASAITVDQNDIVNNSEWGAMNNGTNVLDATDNWWGDADGPSGEGSGAGDAVSTGVDYDPWLTEPVT